MGRGDLVARLREGAAQRMTVVTAPPGWGKTTLLAAWRLADSDRRAFAWVSLDTGDNDPARFWSYVVEALRTAAPELAGALPAARRLGQVAAADAVVPRIVNALAGRDEPVVLALDDYHAVVAEEVHAGVAGLYLAALSLRGRSDAAAFIEAFAGDDRLVVDYLSAELLDRLRAEVRAFLVETSILDRLCGPLCDAVTGRTDSARMLADVERTNLFLVPLDRRREWYRYHLLFRELLQRELALGPPERTEALHRRALAWHLDSGSVREAVSHEMAAGNHAVAAELVAAHWNRYFNRGRLATVRGWLDGLAPQAVRGGPAAVRRARVARARRRADRRRGAVDRCRRARGGRRDQR